MLIDIKRGYQLLEKYDIDNETEHTKYIKARYYYEMTLQKIADEYGCSVSTADRRCESALKALQRFVGGDSPWN
jgi:DNA-directed RNA polymerase specialized sigma24 family protein